MCANTVGKLGETIIAQDLQEIEGLWHERAFAGRKGRGGYGLVNADGSLEKEETR